MDNKEQIDINRIPEHVAIIMDGNGRWAKQRGLVRTEGHKAAEPVVFDTIAGAIEAGVRYLSLYTFSTENWKRSPQEVRFLMGFSRDIIHRRVAQMDEWGVRVRWSGRRPRLWRSVIDELEKAMERTKDNTTIDVVFCINYGGRAEIADAAAAIVSPLRPMYPGPTSMLLCQFLNLFRSVQSFGSLFPPSLSDHVRAM